MRCHLYFDGSWFNSNYQAKGGFVVLLETNPPVIVTGYSKKEKLKSPTEAEFRALQAGLQQVRDIKGITKLFIKGDCRQLIYYINNLQEVKKWKDRDNEKYGYADSILFFLNKFTISWQISWIPREQNVIADRLSKRIPDVFPTNEEVTNHTRHEVIKCIAKEIWMRSGCVNGNCVENWLLAELMYYSSLY